MNKKEQKIPKWFEGELYAEGETVTNPFSGESIELTNVELSLYDFIIGCNEIFAASPHTNGIKVSNKVIKDFSKALTWFRQNNAEAYMVLLD